MPLLLLLLLLLLRMQTVLLLVMCGELHTAAHYSARSGRFTVVTA